MPCSWPTGRNGVAAGHQYIDRHPHQQRLIHLEAPSTDKGLLECVRCNKRYSSIDVRLGRFQLETMVCSFCYGSMQKQPVRNSCFGKPGRAVTEWNSKRQYGYSPTAIECQQQCPDRFICRQLVQGHVH